jgi:dipeptidyl-peptidase-4
VTEGNWEVERVVGVDEAKRRVFYISTEPSPLQRQLWVVDLDGTGKARLTRERGTHSISMSPTTDYYLDTWSNLENPARRVVHSGDGGEWAVYHEVDRKPVDDYEFASTEIVTVKLSDGTPLYDQANRVSSGQAISSDRHVYGGPRGPKAFATPGMAWVGNRRWHSGDS